MDKTNSLRLLAGVSLLLVCGCHSPYSYQPYGYNAYPGTYAPVTQPLGYPQPLTYPGVQIPAGSIPGSIPAGTFPAGSIPAGTFPAQGAPIYPGSPVGQPLYQPGVPSNTGVPLLAPNTGDPIWSPSGDTLDGGYIQDQLPSTYDNIGDGLGGGVPRPKDPDGYGGDNGQFFEEDGLGDPIDSFGQAEPEEVDPELFAQPVAARPASVRAARPAAAPAYDYDEEYRWLKGVLHQDKDKNLWYVVYDFGGKGKNGVPDKYKGDLILDPAANREILRGRLHDGDPVEVNGRVVTANNGQPVYQVSRIAPLAVQQF